MPRKLQLILLAVLVLILFCFLPYIFTHVFVIDKDLAVNFYRKSISPWFPYVIALLCIVVSFTISYFIGIKIHKRQTIAFYATVSYLTILLCITELLGYGWIKDLMGYSCSGFFGVRQSCFASSLLPVSALAFPLLVAAVFIPSVLYLMKDDKSKTKNTKKKTK